MSVHQQSKHAPPRHLFLHLPNVAGPKTKIIKFKKIKKTKNNNKGSCSNFVYLGLGQGASLLPVYLLI